MAATKFRGEAAKRGILISFRHNLYHMAAASTVSLVSAAGLARREARGSRARQCGNNRHARHKMSNGNPTAHDEKCCNVMSSIYAAITRRLAPHSVSGNQQKSTAISMQPIKALRNVNSIGVKQ